MQHCRIFCLFLVERRIKAFVHNEKRNHKLWLKIANTEVREMGIGATIVRGALFVAAGSVAYMSIVNPIVNRIRQDNAVIEAGYVNPKSLSIEGKKNGAGNIETYLQYKAGDEIVSLPCTKGPAGPLCGRVDYWWQSVGTQQREGLAVAEWPVLSNDAKRGILSSELQTLIDSAYGTKTGSQPLPAQQLQYPQQKQK